MQHSVRVHVGDGTAYLSEELPHDPLVEASISLPRFPELPLEVSSFSVLKDEVELVLLDERFDVLNNVRVLQGLDKVDLLEALLSARHKKVMNSACGAVRRPRASCICAVMLLWPAPGCCSPTAIIHHIEDADLFESHESPIRLSLGTINN